MAFRGREICEAGSITTEFPSQIPAKQLAETYGIGVGRELGRGEAVLALIPEGCCETEMEGQGNQAQEWSASIYHYEEPAEGRVPKGQCHPCPQMEAHPRESQGIQFKPVIPTSAVFNQVTQPGVGSRTH